MPIYEYSCEKCNNKFQQFVSKITDSAEGVQCPKCTSSDIIKLVSAPPFHLKGSGWYKTVTAPPAETEAQNASSTATSTSSSNSSSNNAAAETKETTKTNEQEQ